MAEYPPKGISAEELEVVIRREFQHYLAAMRIAKIYADSDEDLRELFRVGKVAQEVCEGVVQNVSTFYAKVLDFGLKQERVASLLALYKNFFPDSDFEFLNMSELERMIQHNLGIREQQHNHLVRRIAGSLNQSVSSLYSSFPSS